MFYWTIRIYLSSNMRRDKEVQIRETHHTCIGKPSECLADNILDGI